MTFQELLPQLPPSFSHAGRGGTRGRKSPCTTEAVNEALGLGTYIGCPLCASTATRQLWGLLLPFNDMWGSCCPTRHRTRSQLRLLEAVWNAPECPESLGGHWSFALADLAARVWGVRELEVRGLPEEAQQLRDLQEVTSPYRADVATATARSLRMHHTCRVLRTAGTNNCAGTVAQCVMIIGDELMRRSFPGLGIGSSAVLCVTSTEDDVQAQKECRKLLWGQFDLAIDDIVNKISEARNVVG